MNSLGLGASTGKVGSIVARLWLAGCFMLGLPSCGVDERRPTVDLQSLEGPDADTPENPRDEDATLLPELRVEPEAVSFGRVTLGFPARDDVFVLNVGQAPMPAPAVDLVEGSDVDYAILQSSCEESVEPGARCEVRLALLPGKVGEIAGALRVASAVGGEVVVPLAGTGLAGGDLVLGPAPGSAFDLGGVLLEGTREGTFRLTNPSSVPSGPLTISLSHPEFAVRDPAPGGCVPGATSLVDGSSCDIRVGFSPSRRGSQQATFTVESDNVGAVSVAVKGRGLSPGILVVSADAVDFQQVVLGDSGAGLLLIENSGDEPLVLSSIGLSGDNSDDFAIQNSTCGAGTALGGGKTCSVALEFRPVTVSGRRSASIQVQTDRGDSAAVALVGEALDLGALTIRPLGEGSAEFGPVRVRETSVRPFQITNPGDQPSGALAVRAGGDFAVLAPPEPGECEPDLTTLVSGQSCTVRVAFTPSRRRARSASLLVLSPLAGATSLPLSGSGIVPADLAVVQNEFDFGRVVVGDSAFGSVTLINAGDEPLTPPELALVNGSRGSTAPFGFESACSAPLVFGETCEVRVTFRPEEAAPHWATLRLTGDGGSVASALLLGEALQGGSLILTAADGSPDFGDVPLDSVVTRPFTVVNPGLAASGRLTITATSSDNSFSVDEGDCNPEGGAGLVNGQSCTFNVSFQPVASGTINASILVASPGAGSVGVQITGTGRTPASLSATGNRSFGIANVDQDSLTAPENEFMWTVSNDGDLPSGSLTLVNANSAEFLLSGDTCSGNPLGGHSSCQMTIRFRPQAAGSRTGALTLTDSAQGERSLTLAMTGTGVTLAGPGESCLVATCAQGVCTRGKCCDRECDATCQVCNDTGQCIDQSAREACGGGQCFGVDRCLLPEGQPCTGADQCGSTLCERRLGAQLASDQICCLDDCAAGEQCNAQTALCQVPLLGQGAACGAPGQAACAGGLSCKACRTGGNACTPNDQCCGGCNGDQVCTGGVCDCPSQTNGLQEIDCGGGRCITNRANACCSTASGCTGQDICDAADDLCKCPTGTRECVAGSNQCIANNQCCSACGICQVCSNGTCGPATPGTACPTGQCNAAGQCVGCLNDANCADGNACNGSERCVAGQCQPGAAFECPNPDPQNCQTTCQSSGSVATCSAQALPGRVLTLPSPARTVSGGSITDVAFSQGVFGLVMATGEPGVFYGPLLDGPVNAGVSIGTRLIGPGGGNSFFSARIHGRTSGQGQGDFLVTYGLGGRGGSTSLAMRVVNGIPGAEVGLGFGRSPGDASFRGNPDAWAVLDSAPGAVTLGAYTASSNTYAAVSTVSGDKRSSRIAANGANAAVVSQGDENNEIELTAFVGAQAQPVRLLSSAGSLPDITSIAGGDYGVAWATASGLVYQRVSANGAFECQLSLAFGSAPLRDIDEVAVTSNGSGVFIFVARASGVRLYRIAGAACNAPELIDVPPVRGAGSLPNSPGVAAGPDSLVLVWSETNDAGTSGLVQRAAERRCQ